MNASDKLDQIAPALVAALGKIRNPEPKKRGQVRGNPNYKYVDLADLANLVRSAFKDVGLALSQETISDSEGVGVVTRIFHLSGQWLEYGPLMFQVHGTAQDAGSALTYARRYALAAAVGVAADEDDDGKQASEPRSRTATGSDQGSPPTRTNPRGSPSHSDPDEAHSTPSEAPTISSTSGSDAAEGGSGTDGEAGTGPSPATPEQRTRLLHVYKKPSEVKAKAAQLFGYDARTLIITDLSSSEVEALILEAAS